MRHVRPAAPYANLTPDRILDALDSIGLRGDGRLLALNSYENRVYLVNVRGRPRRSSRSSTARSAGPTRRSSRSTRSSPNSPSARFRPWRRSRSTARTLHRFDGFRFARLSAARRPHARTRRPRHAGMDRPLHRPHPRGRRARALRARAPRSTSRRFGDEPRALPARPRLHAARPARSLRSVSRPWRLTACATASSAPATCARSGCTATATPATCCGRTDGPHFVDFDDARIGPGGAGPVDAAVRRPRRR